MRYRLFYSLLIFSSSLFVAQGQDRSGPAPGAGISFAVSAVTPAKKPLKTFPARAVLEQHLGRRVRHFPDSFQNQAFVPAPGHAFVETLQECYDAHRPLVLSPDAVWTVIAQGIAQHINHRYDSLKSILFASASPQTLVVRNDSLEKSAQAWASLMNGFTRTARGHFSTSLYELMVPRFSTTGPVEHTVFEITLLNAVQKHFRYIGESGCGIPSIRLKGSPEDWQAIRQRLDSLDRLGLGHWARAMKPVLEEIEASSRGQIRKEFWEDLYKNAREYNAFHVSGWCIKFFPYIKEWEETGKMKANAEGDEMQLKEKLLPNPFLQGDDYYLSTLTTENFPDGYGSIAVKWENHWTHTTEKLTVAGGFTGIRQHADLSLEPWICWAVCGPRISAKKLPEVVGKAGEGTSLRKAGIWSPHILDEVVDSAVYAPKIFKTHRKSRAFLGNYLRDSLRKKPGYTRISPPDRKVRLVVLANGRLQKAEIPKSWPAGLRKRAEMLLFQLPEPWFPALAEAGKALDLMGEEDEDETPGRKPKIRVNSVVEVRW